MLGGLVGEEGGMRDYKFSVTGTFRKPLLRQIDEGLRLDQCEAEGGILNKKMSISHPKLLCLHLDSCDVKPGCGNLTYLG